MVLAAAACFWLRSSLTTWYSFFVDFLVLMWVTVAWALLLPLLVSPASVSMVVGFFVAFFALLFSGAVGPGEFSTIYKYPALAVFSGFFSCTRFFVESLTVQERRCLPENTGFTVQPYA